MFYDSDRRMDDNYYADDRGRSPVKTLESPSPTIMLRGLSSSVTERDVLRSLDNERAHYTDVRLVKDRRSGRLNAFIDFVTLNDSKQFMRDCRGELEVRKNFIRMTYSTSALMIPKERRDDDRYEEPTSTVMLRGIPSSIDQRDICDVLDDSRVNYVDVRVIKDKHTGVTKGFGFVDFSSVHEAKRWMDYQKNVLRIRRYDLRLSFSASRQFEQSEPPHPAGVVGQSSFMARSASLSEVSTGDWICSRCSSHNFRRREQCYKCQLHRSQVQSLTNSIDGVDLIGTTPCNTLVLRYLDALTTEGDICKVFEDTADVKVRQCHVMRDEISHVSRCFAFTELPTVADAYKVMDIVSKQFQLFEIHGKAVTVSYAKNTFNTIMATLKTEGSYNAQLNSSRNLAVDLAHVAMATRNNFSADTVAMNAVAASALLNQGGGTGAAVANAIMQQKQTEQHVISAIAKSVRAAQDLSQSTPFVATASSFAAMGQPLPTPSFPFYASTAPVTVFPFPDTSKYIYDESTKFYYDPITGLLYEPNSKYFYDRSSQRYYYWDQTRSTYFPVPQATEESSAKEESESSGAQNVAANDDQNSMDSGERVRISKGKSAQQISKEMEKWAKRMNSQKKNPLSVAPKADMSMMGSRTADTGYSMLEAAAVCQNRLANTDNSSLVAQYDTPDEIDVFGQMEAEKQREAPGNCLLEDEGKVMEEETRLLDWAKLACLLCSRGFKDAATLQKHRAFSALHIENLNKIRAKYGLQSMSVPSSSDSAAVQPSSSSSASIASLMQMGAEAANDHAKSVANRQAPTDQNMSAQYRDRAQERRDRYGAPSPPKAKKYTEKPPVVMQRTPPVVPPVVQFVPPPPVLPQPPAGPTVGSRLMEKMGWQAGQGLGRANQGRTQIIEAEFREAGVGLGVKSSKRGPPSDNYKDNVKRAMFARFHDNDE